MKSTTNMLYPGLGAAALFLAAFGLIAWAVVEGKTQAFDMSILLSLRQPGHPDLPVGPAWLPEAVRDVTSLGSFSVLGLLVVLVVVYLLILRKPAAAVWLAGTVIGGTFISNTLKVWFDRPRPELTGVAKVFTSSFPSGHSMMSAVTYLAVGAIVVASTSRAPLRSFYIGAAAVLTLIVGISRVYLGVHYPTDVLAGWCLGSAWVLVCSIGGYLWQTRRRTLVDTSNSA